MNYTLDTIDNFLSSIETDIINILYDYNLLTRFTPDVKKIVLHNFVHLLLDKVKSSDTIFIHNKNISKNHELLKYFDYDKLNSHINKICIKLKKVTHRIIFVKDINDIPASSKLDKLDGSIIDEIILLEYSNPINPKELKKFLDDHSLMDMYKSISKKVC